MSAAAADAPAAVRLWLMRLASPALPVGGFSYSEGLESAVDRGLVHDADSATTWLRAQLHTAQARCDLPLLAHAMAAWAARDEPRARTLNDWLMHTRETHELRRQTEQMGRSMALWLAQGEHTADPRVATLAALPPAPGWPLSFALAAVLGGATPHDALLAFAFGWAENQVQAALKAVPLGQAAGQRVLAALAAEIPAAVADALARDDDTRQAFTPRLAILSARHEQQYSRLFRS